MNLKNNTILITGGSSGIGLELSKRFLAEDNTVIICGRSVEKLEQVKKSYPNIEIYPCDISDRMQCSKFVTWIKEHYPKLNVLVNNAAIVHKTNFMETESIVEMAELEINTNFLAPIYLIKNMLPVMRNNERPSVINITTGLVYCPRAVYPFYNATKAALHSFTQVLRIQLKETEVNIIEVLFPAVNTPWHKGKPPKIAISTDKAVNEMIIGLKKGKKEIKIAGVKLLSILARVAPKFALHKINSLKES